MSSYTSELIAVDFGNYAEDLLVRETVEHVNEDHGDTVRFVADHLRGAPFEPGTLARIASIDRSAIVFELDGSEDGTGADTVTMALEPPVADVGELQVRVYAAIGAARAAADESVPLTSLEQDFADAALLRSAPGRIERVRELDPILLEVVVSGLEDFAQVTPDTFIFVMVDTTGRPIDPAFDIEAFQQQGLDGPVRGAYYTVRGRDPFTGWITFWVVRHDGGAVADWFEACSPGDTFVGWGPRPGFVPAEDAEAYLLVADETGYAAVAAIIEQAPRNVDVVAILECGEVDPPAMPPHPRLDLRPVRRSGPPGSGDEVLEVVAALDLGEVGRWTAFGGAESHQITRVRRLLRNDRGLASDRVLMTGYWRLAATNGS